MLYNWFQQIEFAFPLAFGLFALIPLLIIWYARQNNRQQAVIKVSSAYAFTVKSWKNITRTHASTHIHTQYDIDTLSFRSLVIISFLWPGKRYYQTTNSK